ncbi:MAG: T9SS type A sorting domain-containing protein [Candidatus Stygibacter australis]|nr:T9SS type A sorting domain-containing protein [Candidatus Stygibacter australis]
MKRIVILFLILLMVNSILGQVNGVREDLAEGRMKVRCWGTHAERGYAQGYLLAEESVQLFEDYVIGYMYNGSNYMYEMSRTLFLANWEIDAEYLEEFAAALEGISDAGESIYITALGREIDEYDIAMVNAVVDVLAYSRSRGLGLEMCEPFGCATLSSWGESTEDDPLLSGDLIVTRHLDWNGAGILDNYPLLLVCVPDEEDEQPYITFTYPLFVTGLSATNASGLTCFMDVGSDNTIVNAGPYKPVLLTMRKAIEMLDYDGSGVCDQQDMVNALSGSNSVTGAIITCVQGNGEPPVIIEQNNVGTAVRTQADNSLNPAIIGDNLVATNHFRVLYPPQYCNRYANLAAEIEGDSDFTAERQWQVLADEAGQGTWTRMTIQICPAKGECKWTSTQNNTPAYNTNPTIVDIQAELQGWVNEPWYAPRTAPVFLFLEDGISEGEPEILTEFAGYRADLGTNTCWDITFLADPQFVIDEYIELTDMYNINELPTVLIRGYHAWTGGLDNYSRALYNKILESSPVKMKIIDLDTENNVLHYTTENIVGVAFGEYHIAYTIWEDSEEAGIDNLALNWQWEDEELMLPEAGETELYELELDVPAGDWEDRELGIYLVNEASGQIIQSASTADEYINPVQVSYNGLRDEEIHIGESDCIFDTLTIFNTSEEESVCELEYDLSSLDENVNVTAEITRANGEEISMSAEDVGEFSLLPGEYLYLVTSFTGLYDTYWEFCLLINSEEGLYGFDIPFTISRMTDNDEGEVSTAISEIYNYPNPFNPSTQIAYNTGDYGKCDLIIYNIRGEEVQRVDGLQGKGIYNWDAKDFSSGVYFYKLSGALDSRIGKMVLMK